MPSGKGHNGGFNPYRDANGRFAQGAPAGGGGRSSSGGGSRPSVRPDGYKRGEAAPVHRPGSKADKKSYNGGRKGLASGRHNLTIGAARREQAHERSIGKVKTSMGRHQVSKVTGGVDRSGGRQQRTFDRGMRDNIQAPGIASFKKADGFVAKVVYGKGRNAAAKGSVNAKYGSGKGARTATGAQLQRVNSRPGRSVPTGRPMAGMQASFGKPRVRKSR